MTTFINLNCVFMLVCYSEIILIYEGLEYVDYTLCEENGSEGRMVRGEYSRNIHLCSPLIARLHILSFWLLNFVCLAFGFCDCLKFREL